MLPLRPIFARVRNSEDIVWFRLVLDAGAAARAPSHLQQTLCKAVPRQVTSELQKPSEASGFNLSSTFERLAETSAAEIEGSMT